jgi:two-component sensor histidine kinase
MIEWEASLSLSEELAVARLHDLTTQLISCEDVQSAVNITMDAAIELHQADFGTFQVLRSESHDLEIVAQRGFKEDFLEAFRSVSADDPCACGRALREQKPIIIKDVIKDNEFTPYREIALEAGYRAVVAMPMVSGDGEFSGVLSTHFRKPRIPSSPQLHVGTLYARQAAEILARLKREQALKISRNKQTLAAKELSHRVKNVLTMVQALSRESMKGATGLSEYAEAFEARIKALAHAHEALSESDWHPITIERLLKEQLATNGSSQFILSGPDVSLSADQAYLLSLVFHELGVNARKHGALSLDTGRVSIEWRMTPEGAYLKWMEAGGPLVSVPHHVGFGTALIRDLTRSGLLTAESVYDPTGLKWTLRLPIAANEQKRDSG